MNNDRRTELKDCQQLMKNVNTITILTAESASTHLTRVMVEPDDLDKEIGEIYAQGVAELRKAFRTLSMVEEKLEPVANEKVPLFNFLRVLLK